LNERSAVLKLAFFRELNLPTVNSSLPISKHVKLRERSSPSAWEVLPGLQCFPQMLKPNPLLTPFGIFFLVALVQLDRLLMPFLTVLTLTSRVVVAQDLLRSFRGSDPMPLVQARRDYQTLSMTYYSLNADPQRYYVTAAPQCPFPDAFLGSVLNAVGFDAVYVQCELPA